MFMSVRTHLTSVYTSAPFPKLPHLQKNSFMFVVGISEIDHEHEPGRAWASEQHMLTEPDKVFWTCSYWHQQYRFTVLYIPPDILCPCILNCFFQLSNPLFSPLCEYPCVLINTFVRVAHTCCSEILQTVCCLVLVFQIQCVPCRSFTSLYSLVQHYR